MCSKLYVFNEGVVKTQKFRNSTLRKKTCLYLSLMIYHPPHFLKGSAVRAVINFTFFNSRYQSD